MKKPKVALALGSGTARGLAHIGVIKVFVENKIPIDLITGTSMGALVGSFYAYSLNIHEIERLALKTNNKALFTMLDPSFRSGLIKGEKIEDFLKNYLKSSKFSKLKIPFVCVACDIKTGNAVYFHKGDLIKSIRASISIPLIFTPVLHNKKVLVDGGLTEPVPVKAAKKFGADIVFAVNLDSDKKIRKEVEPSLKRVAYRTTEILLYQLSKHNADMADVVISPHISHYESVNFSDAKKFIEEGERAAKKALPKIKKVLKDFNF